MTEASLITTQSPPAPSATPKYVTDYVPRGAETRIDSIIDQLVIAAGKAGLSKKALALATKMHPNTLVDFARPEWSPSIGTIRRLEQKLLPPVSSGTTQSTT